MPVYHQISILYLVWLGTLFTAKRPSYDNDANVHGSTKLQATPADVHKLLMTALHHTESLSRSRLGLHHLITCCCETAALTMGDTRLS